MTARMAAAVDDLSNGRLILGVGAGWQVREHHNYGYDLLELPQRMARFAEGLEIIHHLLKRAAPLDYPGQYYQLHEAILLPRPQRQAVAPIQIVGNGEKRTLPLVARYADEWNGVYLPPARYRQLNQQLNELLTAAGRDPSAVRRSLMTRVIFGQNDAALQAQVAETKLSVEALRERGVVVGTAGAIVEQLGHIAEAGAQRVMLQWLDLDDLDGLAALAAAVL